MVIIDNRISLTNTHVEIQKINSKHHTLIKQFYTCTRICTQTFVVISPAQFDINKSISINDINTSLVPNPIAINHTTNLKRHMPLAESIKNNHVIGICVVLVIDLAYWILVQIYTCNR